jgi:hypothetical protein
MHGRRLRRARPPGIRSHYGFLQGASQCGKAAAGVRVFADASRPVALDASSEMIARAVEDADRRLRDLRREEWEDGALAAATCALAIAASVVHPTLALPLFVGAMFVAGRAMTAEWRRWDLLEALVLERDAYALTEVRVRAEQEASMVNRGDLSRTIRSRLEFAESPRVVANADQFAALADELVDPLLELDPACAVACSRLLSDYVWSPLVNEALPAEDVRSRLVQIRSGFHPSDES